MAGAGDIVSGSGGAIASLFGSDEAPRAVLNRYAAPTARAAGKLAAGVIGDTGALSQQALDAYMAGQPIQQRLAGQQEDVLQTLLRRRMGSSPEELLGRVGGAAFGLIDPNVVAPLSKFDVNYDTLSRRARGLNPAAVDSTADKLRTSRIASGRYYDTARDVINRLPQLYGQAAGIDESNLAAAAGYVPQIAGAYENVASRPTTGILNRIGTANAAQGLAGSAIQNVTGATQGFKQPRNFADRIGAASQDIGTAVNGIASLAGAAGGAGGGGL